MTNKKRIERLWFYVDCLDYLQKFPMKLYLFLQEIKLGLLDKIKEIKNP